MKYITWTADKDTLLLGLAKTGMLYVDIAEIIKCPKGAVQQRLKRLGYSRAKVRKPVVSEYGYRNATWPADTWFGPRHLRPAL